MSSGFHILAIVSYRVQKMLQFDICDPNFRKPSISAQFSKCILFALCFLQGQRNGLAKFQLDKLSSVGNTALDIRTSK